ncbi:mannose-6-phosphate isomerase, type 2 [Pricia antarctica]|uniref:Mannose-6-phosphate isomerase, type 2 n=1 Tax=Pricia antarctica TaxID=641691 RepID=A0A1G7I7A7_9FLAO|nr:glycosyltransferase family 4 protein [Pricia antarctica]SDF08555.1 mannose-6-phosphate isomerase, type 2 [Pricia antarctica]
MRIAILSSIAWRTPPRRYGPWELVASTIAESLVAKGFDVTLFATGDSRTSGKLDAICPKPYEEDRNMDPKVWESLHISNLMEKANTFDIIHNHFDFLPLTYSRLIDTPMVTTIHGFSSEKIIPVYKKYNPSATYISISDADRHPDLNYYRTIYHGIDSEMFEFNERKADYLLSYGRIHPDKGTLEAIQIANAAGYPIKIAGLIQDQGYFDTQIAPLLNDGDVTYLGNLDQSHGNELLGRAKALLHPISFDEPFGLSVAEAMMCGTPVIAFNRGSMAELIAHGKSGFLVRNVPEAVEALKVVKDLDPFFCRAYAKEKFSIHKMLSEYIQVFEDIAR